MSEKHNDTKHLWRNVDVTLELEETDGGYHTVSINGVRVVNTWKKSYADEVHQQLWDNFSHQDLMED